MFGKNGISFFQRKRGHLEQFPEHLHDELEAYPLRLNVSALPERRFFKMIRTLTVLVVLAGALLISLAVFLNYQITHLDITLYKNGRWQFYQIDPMEKRLYPLESSTKTLNPLAFVIEAKLRDYLIWRNNTTGSDQQIKTNINPGGRIFQFSGTKVWAQFVNVDKPKINQRDDDVVRETHIYDLQLVDSRFPYLWLAYIEIFELPATEDFVGICLCSDNSQKCLDCKKQNAIKRERYRVWMRTSFSRPHECKVLGTEFDLTDSEANLCLNPLGISVDTYIPTIVPIHDENTYWDLPPVLRAN